MATLAIANQIQYKQLGAAVLFLLILAIMVLLLQLDWLNMPLSASPTGAELSFFGYSLPMLVLTFYLTGALLGLLHFPSALPFLLVPVLLALCWPIIIANETSGLLPNFFDEARARALVEQVFRLRVQNNYNMQPAYNASFDVRSVLERTLMVTSNLSFGWYAFVIMGMFIPLTYRLVTASRARTTLYYLAMWGVVIMIFAFYYVRDPYRINTIPMDAGRSVNLIDHCSSALSFNPELASSDYFVTLCARAYVSYAGWSGPVAHIPVIYDFMGDQNFIYMNKAKFAEIEHRLTPLLYMPVKSPMDRMFRDFGQRHYRTFMSVKALEAIREQKYNLAATMLANNDWFRDDIASWVLFGYARARQGQLHAAISSFEEAVQELENDTVIANLYCTLGDAMVANMYFKRARHFYLQCANFDNERNYWAVSGLGGT